jgi:hypothetical protein
MLTRAGLSSYLNCTSNIYIPTSQLWMLLTRPLQQSLGGTTSSSMLVCHDVRPELMKVCCTAARAFNPVLWDRLREFAAYEMERLPREKNVEVIQGHLIYSSWK